MVGGKNKKYFFDCDDWIVYEVPKKLWPMLDIIKNPKSEDMEVNEAKDAVISESKPILIVTAMTQTL
jgi:hypothetical protein